MKRVNGESFAAYKARRAANNESTKARLCPRMLWQSSGRTGKGTHVRALHGKL